MWYTTVGEYGLYAVLAFTLYCIISWYFNYSLHQRILDLFPSFFITLWMVTGILSIPFTILNLVSAGREGPTLVQLYNILSCGFILPISVLVFTLAGMYREKYILPKSMEDE